MCAARCPVLTGCGAWQVFMFHAQWRLSVITFISVPVTLIVCKVRQLSRILSLISVCGSPC